MSCCIPLRTVKSVSVNTKTNVATLTLDAAPPATGLFNVRFCNATGLCCQPVCITPCQTPQATVVLTYGGVTYTAYNCHTGGVFTLSQIVKRCMDCGPVLHFRSGYASSGIVLNLDCLPCANVAYSTVTSPAAAGSVVAAETTKPSNIIAL